MVEVDEVLDAQTIDVGVVRDTLQGKMLAEVGTIDANLLGKLCTERLRMDNERALSFSCSAVTISSTVSLTDMLRSLNPHCRCIKIQS